MLPLIYNRRFSVLVIMALLGSVPAKAQVTYGASVSYGTNRVNPAYTGNAVQLRRACDNATVNIGFTTCGDLDTLAINAFAGLQNLPLTSLTSPATAAYSLRRLNCSYPGSAINIRSTAAGSPTMNIGFTVNGDLDTAALKTFIGSNSAYVTTWYDQSGNGKNVQQPVAANQPRIANAGLIMRQNGRPAVNFISASSTSFYLNTLMMTDKISVSLVARVNNAAARNTLFDLGSIPSGYPDFAIEANTYVTAGNKWGFYGNNNSLDGTVATSTSLTCVSVIAQNTYTGTANLIANTNFYVNGTASPLSCRSCVTSTYRTAWPNGFTIGNFNGAYVSYTDGYIAELIIFPSALSTTERQFLDWTQAQYYGIATGVALGTLPGGTLPSAFVQTWYDQSGNGKNLAQATNSLQPRMVNTGVVDKQNYFPAVYFTGSSYLTEGSLVCARPYFATATAALTGAPLAASLGYARFLNLSSTGDSYGFLGTYGGGPGSGSPDFAAFVGNGAATWNDVAANTPLTPVAAAPAILSMSVQAGAGNLVPYINGTAQTGKDGTGVSSTGFIAGGAWGGTNTTQLWTGYSYGLHIFNSAIGQTRRVLIESNQSAYNANLVISGSKYVPPAVGSYNKYVIGIGRTSAADTVCGTVSTLGMGMIAGTTGADYLKSDGDYLTCGINCPVGPGTSVLNLPPTIVQRWNNDWYINKTDAGATGGNVKLYFDFSDYGYTAALMPGVAANYELMYRSSPAGTFTIVAGTIKAVVGDRVEFDLDAGLITTNFYYTIGTKNKNLSPLPIGLLDFSATANGSEADLAWATATEINSRCFTVERSRNGIDFDSLTTVQSKALNGNSASRLDYAATDPAPYPGLSYYRLRCTDYSGTGKYSNIAAVDFTNDSKTDISVFPNPNQGHFTIGFTGFRANVKAQVVLTDARGTKVYEREVLLTEETRSVQIAPAEKIARGFYFLCCVVDGTTYTRKVIVQ